MKNIFCVLLCYCSVLNGQLTTNNFDPPENIEEGIKFRFTNVGVVIHKVEILNSNREAIGIFENGIEDIAQNRGFMLSTGEVQGMTGSENDLLSSSLNTPGFTIFDSLYNAGPTYDATYMRVVFTPIGQELKFDYVFASENYGTSSCITNSDWLGIFVRPQSEWGSNNWENLATVPGKPTVPVNSNTINTLTGPINPSACLQFDPTWQENHIYFNEQSNGLKFNGMTGRLPIRNKSVTPLERYEMIVVIADGKDPFNDSAIFFDPHFFQVRSSKPFRVLSSSQSSCVGQSLVIEGQELLESGKYVFKISEESSPIDTFRVVNVKYSYRTEHRTHYICPGESITIGDTTLFSPIIDFPDTVAVEGQCHKIIYHDIFYKGGNRTEKYHQLCDGGSLQIGDQIFTSSGYYEERVPNSNGCDDLILHHFDFSDPIQTEEIYNACAGDTMIVEGIPYTNSASFARTYNASGGCDSIVHYEINFDAPVHKIVKKVRNSDRGIPYDTLFLADTFFVRNAIYFEYKEAAEGCDTLVEYRINIRSLEVVFDEGLDDNICVGEEVNLILGQNYFIKKGYKEWATSVEDSIIGSPNPLLSSTINVGSYPVEAEIENVQDLSFIGISMEHERITDLDVTLTCPNGKSVLLTKRSASNHPIILSTDSSELVFWTPYHIRTWDEYGSQVSNKLYAGSEFRSYEDLNELVGCPLNGPWKMEVKDYWATTNGYWWDWSIAFPDDEPTFKKEDTGSWGWYLIEGDHSQIDLQVEGDFRTYGFPDAKLKASSTGKYTILNSTYVTTNFYLTEPKFSFSVTEEYDGPVESLDTILCTPTLLYDSLITQSGTYELIKDHPDYCDGIPVVVDVTAIPPDTTFLSTTTCEFSDSDLNIETLSNQYGCDSLIFTGIQLVVDTVFSQNISCLPNITTINRSFETLEVVVDNACDYVSLIEHIEVPIDTTYLEEIVCGSEVAGVTTTVLPNQFGCDSVIITDHVLALDTTYISSTTCQFEEAGIQEITLTNGYGCDSLIIADIVLEVDTVFTSPIECNPAIDAPSTEIVVENINVEDGCDYVSIQEILSAPVDTTYLVTPSCQVRDSLPVVEVLDNQFGCDSVVITSFNLRFDTLTHIINTCTAGIASPQQLIDTEWLINENACDTFQITITNLLPLDTTLVTMASCNPQDTGTFYQTLPNQYLCDSIVITEVEFDPDTLYLATNTCYPQDSGWHLQILEQVDGCQTLEWTYRQYIPLEYDWLIAADTCGFGQGSASFVPTNSDLDYAFEWDGPAAEIDPTALFQGVYNVTITATGDTYPEACVDTSRVIIGGISALPQATFTYEASDLDYQFSGEVIEADTFYWDFGDGNISIEINPAHTFAETGTYTVCLIAQNGCGTQQDCQAVVTIKDYSIEGKIETAPNFPVSSGINGVKVKLSGEQVNLEGISNAEGGFNFPKQFEGYDYSLQPEKEDDILNGLDVSDILKIAQAANGARELEAPYELLAADVNCDASITTEDALYLNQLLLGQQNQFPDDCSSWIFWPQSYVFPTPAEPFNPNTAILIENLQAESLNNDYYGLKRGDVGANADAARSPTELDTLFLQIENGIIQAGDTIQLDFRVRNFSELVGVQFEFLIDTFALTFHDISLGDLEPMTMEHFGTDGFEEGILRVIWLDILGQPHSLADGDVLFSLQLIAKQKINDRQSKMEISTRDLAASYFNEALEEGVVQLLIDDLVDIVNVNNEFFQLGQNRPNPFQQTTIIPFQLSTAAPINLKVYSQLGQLVWQEKGRFPAGKSELEVDIRAPGIYYYSIETPWGKATRKMVRVE